MSSRTASLALLGLSAVAAGYFLVFRRKEKKEVIEEEEVVEILTTEKEEFKEKFNEDDDAIGEEDSSNEHTSIISSITEQDDLTLEEGLEDNLDSGNEASEDFQQEEISSSGRMKNESLMEWIERQLKEAEARGLSSSKLTTEERKLFSNEVVKEEIKTEEGCESIKKETSSEEVLKETTSHEEHGEFQSMESMVIIDKIKDEVQVNETEMDTTSVVCSEKRKNVHEIQISSTQSEDNNSHSIESSEIKTSNVTTQDKVEDKIEVTFSEMKDRDCDTGESMVIIDRIPRDMEQTVDSIEDIKILAGGSDEYIKLLQDTTNGSDKEILEDVAEEASVNVPTLINLYETRLKDE